MADLVVKPSRVPYASSSEDDAKDAETIKAIEADMPRIRAAAKEAAVQYESEVVRHLIKTGLLDLSRVVATLTAKRVARSATLDDIRQATGIPVAHLSGLEAGKLEHPTLPILQRYAAAVGLRLVVDLTSDAPAKADAAAGAP